MTLGRKELTSGAIKGLTVCCVCFTRETCCFVFLSTAVLLHCPFHRLQARRESNVTFQTVLSRRGT
ncbi:unnamed protein product, partial [Staurois parvus]